MKKYENNTYTSVDHIVNSSTVYIESLAYHGDGVGHLPDGRAVFVEGAVPGDHVSLTVLENHPRYARARIMNIHSSSSQRIEPSCPHHASCGGCPWQHIHYHEQLQWKQRLVIESLRRIGSVSHVDSLVAPTVAATRVWGYRNKVEFEVAVVDRSVVLGFHARNSNDVVPIESCQLLPRTWRDAPRRIAGALTYACREITPYLQRLNLRISETTKDIELSLWTEPCYINRKMVARVLNEAFRTTSMTRVIVDGKRKERKVKQVEVLSGRGYWREQLDGRIIKLSSPSFYQVNSPGASILVDLVLRLLEHVQLDSSSHIADLYAGAGTFTLPLAARYANVSAIESYSSSIKDLRRNLQDNQLAARVIGGDVARELPLLDHVNAAIIDPPRNGLSNEARKALISARPDAIVYISCNPTTLARDIKDIIAAGYKLLSVHPVDLFPQTYHIESVSLLTVS